MEDVDCAEDSRDDSRFLDFLDELDEEEELVEEEDDDDEEVDEEEELDDDESRLLFLLLLLFFFFLSCLWYSSEYPADSTAALASPTASANDGEAARPG